MEIPLKPEFESMIRERVGTGQYVTAASVVEEGLLLLELKETEDRKLEELKREVQVGINQLSRGEYTAYESPSELVVDVETRGLERLRQKTGTAV